MFKFLMSILDPERPPTRPTHLAIYDCACCKERFYRNPHEQSISASDSYATILGAQAWKRVTHGCSAMQHGLAYLVGMKAVQPEGPIE